MLIQITSPRAKTSSKRNSRGDWSKLLDNKNITKNNKRIYDWWCCLLMLKRDFFLSYFLAFPAPLLAHHDDGLMMMTIIFLWLWWRNIVLDAIMTNDGSVKIKFRGERNWEENYFSFCFFLAVDFECHKMCCVCSTET